MSIVTTVMTYVTERYKPMKSRSQEVNYLFSVYSVGVH